MPNSIKRDNAYWLRRLDKDGRSDLLARIDAGEITVYRGTQIAGYRKKASKSPAALLSYHWSRADHVERKRFVVAHLHEVNRVMRDVRSDLMKLKAQKPTE